MCTREADCEPVTLSATLLQIEALKESESSLKDHIKTGGAEDLRRRLIEVQAKVRCRCMEEKGLPDADRGHSTVAVGQRHIRRVCVLCVCCVCVCVVLCVCVCLSV